MENNVVDSNRDAVLRSVLAKISNGKAIMPRINADTDINCIMNRLPADIKASINIIVDSVYKHDKVEEIKECRDGSKYIVKSLVADKKHSGFKLNIEETDVMGKMLVEHLAILSGRYSNVFKTNYTYAKSDVICTTHDRRVLRYEVKVRTSLRDKFMVDYSKYINNNFFIFVCLYDFKIYCFSDTESIEGKSLNESCIYTDAYGERCGYDFKDTVNFDVAKCRYTLDVFSTISDIITYREVFKECDRPLKGSRDIDKIVGDLKTNVYGNR